MLSVREAQKKVLECRIKIRKEKVPILKSLGLVLAEDLKSDDFIPAYDNSAMDGYAVKSVDIVGADKNYPIKLKLLDEDIPAGKKPVMKIESGYCMKIMTGAPVPEGCDCVVMKEDVLREGSHVLVFRECKKGENIRLKGEDISRGETVLSGGKKIYPGDIGVMASIGITDVKVFAPPSVGILVTGDELIDISDKLEVGKVRDSNSYSLAAQIIETGAGCSMFGIIRDEKTALRKKILECLKECDILLLTGGVSVGDYDYAKEILDDIGAEFVFWRVNQRPGKPMAFLTYKDKFIFGLPGNPVSVMVCFEMYVRPLIKRIMSDKGIFRKKVNAKAMDDFKHRAGRVDFVRVKIQNLNGELYFKPTGMQGSGILTSMAEADGIAVFPEGSEVIEKDSGVEIYLLK